MLLVPLIVALNYPLVLCNTQNDGSGATAGLSISGTHQNGCYRVLAGFARIQMLPGFTPNDPNSCESGKKSMPMPIG